MPIYEYEHVDEEGCAERGHAFEEIQRLSDDALSICPDCGRPVRRLVSRAAVTRSTRDLLAPSNLAAKGFTQYRKSGDGVYEKTAGKGPRHLHRD